MSHPHASQSPRTEPWTVSRDEWPQCPQLTLAEGIGGPIVHAVRHEDGRFIRQGIVVQAPGHEPFQWEQAEEETHYCLEGRIDLWATDRSGTETQIQASAGEYLYLPGGYTYRIESSGLPTSFFWTTFPGKDVDPSDPR